MLLMLKEQRINILKNRDRLLQQLESKYAWHINTLLQQKLSISATITKQHDEMIHKINQKINNCVYNQTTTTQFPIATIINEITTNYINPGPDITLQPNENKSNVKTEHQKKIKTSHVSIKPELNDNLLNRKQSVQHKWRKRLKNEKLKNPALCIYVPGVNLKCNECNQLFDKYKDFDNHMKINHNILKGYKCTYNKCNKCYNRRKNLIDHIRNNHMQEVNYKCDICHKGFYHKSNWKHHLIVHKNDRPFKCDQCGKLFKTKRALNGHVQRVHVK